MAATKIFPISVTVHKALAYIAAADKTDNGRLISTFMCSRSLDKAAKDFADVTATGTGRSSVLAQHFIISFQPGEITPEKALEVVKELCEKFPKDQYQYFLAVHNDREHIHVHCIFNNTNMINGWIEFSFFLTVKYILVITSPIQCFTLITGSVKSMFMAIKLLELFELFIHDSPDTPLVP